MNRCELKHYGSSMPVILVVDDDAAILDMMKTFIESIGYRAVLCNCGLEALRIVRTERIDLVLLDIVMADIDGFEVARRMKEFFGKDNFVPIIMVSALNNKENLVSGLEYADDYIRKPFVWEELAARIGALRRTQLLHRELIDARNRYELLFENMPQMSVSLDKDLKILNCNSIFYRKCGIAKQTLIGKNFVSLFEKEDQKKLDSFLRSLSNDHINGSNSDDTVYTMVCSSSSAEALKVVCRAMAADDPRGQMWAVVALEDVSLSLKLQSEQKLARQHLYRSARLASIGTLASGVAHELNNPLTAILGFSSSMLERIKMQGKIETDELIQYLTIINSEALRCRDIVESLSQFAHERGGKIETVRLYDCVEAAVMLVRNNAMKKSIRINNNVEPYVMVMADWQKLQQAILNIVTNSIEFSSYDSSIDINSDTDERIKNFVRLYIRDSGPGISPENQQRVFDPFFTTKEVGKGPGLGLTIAHANVEECNGSIDIISEVGKWTTVVLKLPKAQFTNNN